jgi:hypothetical protein
MMATTTDNVNQEGNTEQCELQLGSRVGIHLSKDLYCEGTVVTIPITSNDDSPSSHFKCRIDYDDGETGWLDTSTAEYQILDNTNDKQFHHGNASKVASLSVGSRIELYWPQYKYEESRTGLTNRTFWCTTTVIPSGRTFCIVYSAFPTVQARNAATVVDEKVENRSKSSHLWMQLQHNEQTMTRLGHKTILHRSSYPGRSTLLPGIPSPKCSLRIPLKFRQPRLYLLIAL